MINSISLVIPSFNESQNIKEVYRRTLEVIKKINIEKYEIIFVENGSKDNSLEVLKKIHSEDKSVKVISLTRNFGYQSAIAAGLKYSNNDYVCIMDGDLQDPPEMISKFFQKMSEGYDVVYGIRIKRKTNFIKNLFYNIFYEIYSKLSEIDVPKKAGDFCLMKKKVVKNINNLSEKNLFIRGLRSWVGFKQTGVEYDRDNRYSGKTNFSFFQATALALDGFVSFSLIPLRFILITGTIISFFSFLFFLFLFLVKIFYIFDIFELTNMQLPIGLTLTNSILTLSLGLVMFTLGIIGEYVGRIYFEVKNRPNYIINEIIQ
jgi:glycosyltransferase involved in cell wall biosynthesis